ncbi:collagenase-like PrtC family protease [Sinorhizobium fredii]
MELICPAGTPAAFREAVDAGADAVYCGFRDETNARNFPGLNFSREELQDAISYARRKGTQTFVALNTFMRAGHESLWYEAAADAVRLGADALILADFGLMAHVAETYPEQRLHVSVQASASNPDAVNFLVEAFGAKRVVLPRALTISDIGRLARQIRCEIEVFVFGGLCVMAEGPLLALLLRYRQIAQHERCVLAGQPCALSAGWRRPRLGARVLYDQPLSARGSGRLPDALQGPLRYRRC